MKLEVSIVYSCKNISEDLLESIKTVSSGIGKISFEVIIISNEIHGLKNLNKKPNLRIIKSKKKGYWTKINQAALLAKGQYLLFSNENILFAPKSIEKMIKRIKEDDKIGVVSPMVLGPDNVIKETIHGPHFLINMKYKLPDINKNKEQFVDVVGEACMLISKTVFESISGFDERYYRFFKRMNLCVKIRKEGYKNLYYPEAKIFQKN